MINECDGFCPGVGPTAFYYRACPHEDGSGITEIVFLLSDSGGFDHSLLLYVPTVSGESEEDPCSRVIFRYLREKIDDHWYVCWQSTD